MLKIVVPGQELFDEESCQFVKTKDQVLKLEHSLLSISKWESKWEVPFLYDDPTRPKTRDMLVDYIKCMTLNEVPDEFYETLTQDVLDQISDYINAKHTATTFTETGSNGKKNNQIVTSELIYYWMVAAQIPMACEKWHINRLLVLIKIYGIENDTKKGSKPKIGKRQQAIDRTKLNAQRRAMLNSKG